MVRICLAFLLVAGFSQLAQARQPGGNAQRAKLYFKAGKTAYAAGRFADAAKLFAEGYRLDPQPAFLLNIAQSHRSNGSSRLALEYYRKYLKADESTAVRSQVEDLIRDLEQKVRDEEASQRKTAPPASAVAPPPPPPASQPERPRAGAPFYHRWWFWTAVGAVVVGTTVGIAAYYGSREPDYVKEGGLGAVRW